MKRLSFTIILLITLLTINLAVSEVYPLTADFSNIQDVLYLKDGNILYSKYESNNETPNVNRVLNKIICVDSTGKQTWECSIPAFCYSPFSSLLELPNECFAYLGRKDDGAFSVLTISKNGELIKEYILPEEISTPILLSDGVLYISAKENIIKKWFWNETIISPEPNSVFNRLSKAETISNRTYISAISNDKHVLLCIDEAGNELWNYSLGTSKGSFVQAWSAHVDNSLVVAFQNNKDTAADSDTPVHLIEINNGKKKWETELSYYPSTIRVQLLLHNNDNSYDLFGRLDENHGICVSVAQDGSVIECVTINAHYVDFVQYKKDIYAIEYNTEGTVSPVSFVNYNLLSKDSFNQLTVYNVN